MKLLNLLAQLYHSIIDLINNNPEKATLIGLLIGLLGLILPFIFSSKIRNKITTIIKGNKLKLNVDNSINIKGKNNKFAEHINFNISIENKDSKSKDLLPNEMVTLKATELEKSSNNLIKSFEELNEGLTLQMNQLRDSAIYIISAKPNEKSIKNIKIGDIKFKNIGIDKYNKLLDEGGEIFLESDEFEWTPNIKGLPHFQNYKNKGLYIKSCFPKKIIPVKLSLFDNNDEVKNEIFTNLIIHTVGRKKANVELSGTQFLAKFKMVAEFKKLLEIKQSTKINIIFESKDYNNLINTFQFLKDTSKYQKIKCIMLSSDMPIFSLKIDQLNDLENIEYYLKFFKEMEVVIKEYDLSPKNFNEISKEEMKNIQLLYTYIIRQLIAVDGKIRIKTRALSESIFKALPNKIKKGYLTLHLNNGIFKLFDKKIVIDKFDTVYEHPNIFKQNKDYIIECNRFFYNFRNS